MGGSILELGFLPADAPGNPPGRRPPGILWPGRSRLTLRRVPVGGAIDRWLIPVPIRLPVNLEK